MYAFAGDLETGDLEDDCRVKVVSPTSWLGLDQNQYSSYNVIHNALVYGFEISWLQVACDHRCGSRTPADCYFHLSKHDLQCSNYCFDLWGDQIACDKGKNGKRFNQFNNMFLK